MSREMFAGGLTQVKRDVLQRIADGERGLAESLEPGTPLDADFARRALDWPWLQ